MNRLTTTISMLAIGLAMTGGVMAQENETLAQFEARCEASGYDDLDDCRSFMTMDTITNAIDMPVEDELEDTDGNFDEPADAPDPVTSGNTIGAGVTTGGGSTGGGATVGGPVTSGEGGTTGNVDPVQNPSGIPVTEDSPTGIPTVPADNVTQ